MCLQFYLKDNICLFLETNSYLTGKVQIFWEGHKNVFIFHLKFDATTLESGITVAPGQFGKKNKGGPIYTLYLYY